MRKLRVLDLFSGIGGFSLGLERTGGLFETAAFCEFADFPRKVLAKHWPDVPIFQDVRILKGSDIDGPIDVICGGYPCQPFSTAGRRKGQEDDRHLWPEFNRLVAELRPSWVIGENVAGHISMGLDDVLSDLEGQGYSARTFVIPACATDAPHRRDRVWTVAYSRGERLHKRGRPSRASQEDKQLRRNEWNGLPGSEDEKEENIPKDVAHAIGGRRPGSGQPFDTSHQEASAEGQAAQSVNGGVGGKRITEPAMGRMVDGISRRMDGHCRWLDEPDIPRVAKGVKDRANRLKALGNAVVPQIPEMIGYAILQAEEMEQ
jgi:DNA (cytosine-5)-methyltransferase 1